MPHTPRTSVDADIERIEAMRDAGTITADEAERLITVLRDVAAAESEIGAAAPPPAPTAPEAPEAPTAPAPPAHDAAPAAPASARSDSPFADALAAVGTITGATAGAAGTGAGTTPGRSTLAVHVIAGDVLIESGDVDEPYLRGDSDDLTLERVGEGWRLSQIRTGWLERLPPADVDVVVPRSFGVALDVKAGNVRIRAVRAVTGRMLAGDLDIDGAEAVDLDKAAGDLDARLTLTSGSHRIRSKAGDVDVRLLPGSDVTIDAEARMGDVDAPRDFDRRRRGVGASASGRVGGGTARLELRLTAGRIRIETEGRHG
jgi:hypothetical protein